MPELSLAPVNFAAGTTPNALAQIGSALGQYPNDVAQAQIQKQAVGNALLAPYMKMLRANASLQNNASFMGTINHIAKNYGIPIPTTGDQSVSEADQSPPSQQTSGQPQTPTTQGAAPQPAGQQAPPKGADVGTVGQPQSFSFGMSAQPDGKPGPLPQMPTPEMAQKLIADKGLPADTVHTTNAQGQTVATSSGAPIPGAPQATPTPSQPTPTAPPKQQLPRIDPSFVGATLDPATVLTLQQMQPEQRAAYLKATGTDPAWVPKSLLTAPVVMDPAQKVKVLDSINTDITKLQNAGNLTPARLQELAHSYESAGLIDPATANSLLEDPETLSQMGKGLQVKLQLLLQSGQLKQDQYNLAVSRLNAYQAGQASLEDYRKFQEQFIGFHEAYMTVAQQQAQQRITLDNERLGADTDHWNALLQQGDDRLAHSDYATLAQDTRTAEANYNSLQSQAAQIKSGNPNADLTTANGPPGPDGKPTGESFAQTLANAKSLKETLEGQLKAANQGYRNPTPALHKLGVQTPGSGAKLKMAGTDSRNGKQVYTDGKGHYFYDQAGTQAVQQ